MIKDQNKLTTAAVVLLCIAAAFFLGKCQGHRECNPVVSETTTIIRDTVRTVKQEQLKWVNLPKKKLPRIRYQMSLRPIDTLLDRYARHTIIDSVKNESGVGISFRHIIQDNDLLESTYDVTYPSIKITELTSTVKMVEANKSALYIGTSAYMSSNYLNQWDVVPDITYRYDQVSFRLGYGLRYKTIHIGISKQLR